jgi:hypothetical protein
MMQPSGTIQEGGVMQRNLVKGNLVTEQLVAGNSVMGKPVTGKLVTGHGAPLLARFAGKFILDIMPAALASVIGGFLLTQYQFGHIAQRPALEQVTPASAEMMALVRDEHAMIIDYLKTQMAAEKSRVAAEDANLARAQEDSKLVDTKTPAAPPATVALLETKPGAEAAPRRGAAVAAAAKPIVWHAKAPVVTPAVASAAAPAPHAPIVIAQADPPPVERLASDPDSLLAKTLDLKDHVVAATRHAVSAIGDMFSTVGGALTPSASLPRQLSSN